MIRGSERSQPMIIVFKYVGAVALFLMTYWTVLYFAQRRLMFPAPTGFLSRGPPADARQVWLPGAAGATEAWWLPPRSGSDRAPPVLLFGHGNGEVIDYWPDAFDEPREWGVAIMLVEYPGYGRSPGRSTQAGIGDAFRAAYDWAVGEGGADPRRVVGYGRSLGGGPVAQLSRERPLAAMILESTFTTTRAFARRFGAPPFLVRDPFDNLAAVRAYSGSLLVIHGTRDDVIPIEQGRALAEAGGVTLSELPCGHNDCPQSWLRIRQLLVGADVLPPAPAPS